MQRGDRVKSTTKFHEAFPQSMKRANRKVLEGTVVRATRDTVTVKWDHLKHESTPMALSFVASIPVATEHVSPWISMIRESGREPTEAEFGMAEMIYHHESRLSGVAKCIPNDPSFAGVELTDEFKVKMYDAACKALYD